MHRRRSLVALAAALPVLAGCGPGADQNLLTDPREIVGKTIAATTTLKTVRIRIDFTSHTNPQAQPGQPAIQPNPDQNGSVELSIDGGHQAYAGRATMNGQGMSPEFVLIGNTAFFKERAGARWTKARVPAGAGLPALLGDSLAAASAPTCPEPWSRWLPIRR